jgi:formate hydrogenlyase subunit 4
MSVHTLTHVLLLLLMPPLLLGIVARTKAVFAGRRGPPLMQPYYDIARLLRKEMVISSATTGVFLAGPAVTLVATLTAALLVPLGHHPAVISFPGDMILFAYLLALGRFFTTTAALDTGSPFEGMGAAREVTFAWLAEPALFLGFVALARMTGSLSLTGMLAGDPAAHAWCSTTAARRSARSCTAPRSSCSCSARWCSASRCRGRPERGPIGCGSQQAWSASRSRSA